MKGSIGQPTSTIIHVPKWAKKKQRRKVNQAKNRYETLKSIRLKVLGK